MIVHHAVAGLHAVAPAVAVVLLVTRYAPWGALLLLFSMLASLVFGIAYHVLLPGPDNMFKVGQGVWAIVFQTTGPALSVLEALGVLAGIRLLMPAESAAGT